MKLKKNEKTFEISGKAQCPECKGTGLRGMSEDSTCAIICNMCNGTGAIQIKRVYQKFMGRQQKEGVKRVFARSCGYGHTADDVICGNGEVIEFSKAGCSYSEWCNGANSKPVKNLYCLYLWTNQGLQNKDVNGLYKDRCSKHLRIGMISECPNYPGTDSGCWDIFEGK